MFKRIVVMVFAACSFSGPAFAAHPLVTDDAATQGRRNIQIELTGELDHDKGVREGVGTEESGVDLAAILSYGASDDIDIVIGLPYQWTRAKENGAAVSEEDGPSDVSIELKWRFYESEGLGLALKPGVTVPTGDEDRGLGSGRPSYGVFFIATRDTGPWALYLNIGYARNENRVDEREDIWHASLAGEAKVAEDVAVVANIGVERDPDKASGASPAFILVGIIYSFSDALDIDLGIKGGLSETETDLSVLAGITIRI